MSREDLAQIFGLTSIITSVLILLWWVLMLIPMPSPDSATLLLDMVSHEAWVLINSLGSFATLLFALVLVGLYTLYYDRLDKMAFLGFLLSFLGWLLYVWIQVEETVAWPVIAQHAPALIDMQGPLFEDSVFSTTYLLMGILFIVGIILFGISFFRAKVFPTAALGMFIVGAILFGLGGPLFVIRTIGVLLEVSGLIWIGLEQRKLAAVV